MRKHKVSHGKYLGPEGPKCGLCGPPNPEPYSACEIANQVLAAKSSVSPEGASHPVRAGATVLVEFKKAGISGMRGE